MAALALITTGSLAASTGCAGGSSEGQRSGTGADAGSASAGTSSSGGNASTGGTGTTGGTTGGTSAGSSGGTATTAGTGGTGGTGTPEGGSLPQDSGSGSVCGSTFLSSQAAGMLASAYASWKTAHTQTCPSANSAVVVNSGNVVSEGIGYGMLLSALNGDKTLFDGLWKFYTDHLDSDGLMNWSLGVCDAPGNNMANAATDADLDAAMGLVMANTRWGGYATDAAGLIAKIKQHETDSCMGLNVLRPGDTWGGCSDPNNMGKVNPSYFAPGYYRVFATIDTANASFWLKLASDSYTLLANYQSQMNGLVPDWANVNGTLGGGYGYNACRTPWRVAMDYLWNCTPAAKTFLDKVSAYVDSQGGVGTVPFDKNSAFLGAFALSGMAVSQSKLDTYVSSWISTQKDDTPYFQGTLLVLYLETASGQFLP
jgi:endo-1,4-beta-D-glucanase Y